VNLGTELSNAKLSSFFHSTSYVGGSIDCQWGMMGSEGGLTIAESSSSVPDKENGGGGKAPKLEHFCVPDSEFCFAILHMNVLLWVSQPACYT